MENKSGLQSEVSIWSKIRSFLFNEIEITDTELSLTPKQEKVFQEVHDFWNQEITMQKVKDFLFQPIEITDDIEL